MTNAPLPRAAGRLYCRGEHKDRPKAIPCGSRAAHPPSPGTRGEGRGEGDFDHQLLATPAHRVRQITLTLTLSRGTGRGNAGKHTAVLRFATTRRRASRTPP